MQDASLQESMGPIVDRTKENLVSTDNGIIMARHRLLRAVKALMEKDATPPGVDPAHQRVRSAAVVLPPDKPFKERREGGADRAGGHRPCLGLTVRPGARPCEVNPPARPAPPRRASASMRRIRAPRAVKVIALDRASEARGQTAGAADVEQARAS